MEPKDRYGYTGGFRVYVGRANHARVHVWLRGRIVLVTSERGILGLQVRLGSAFRIHPNDL